MAVARLLAVGAQQSYAICQIGDGRDDCASVAPASEVLRRIEAEAAECTEGADSSPAVARAVRLAGVLHDVHTGLAGERDDRIHLDGGAEQVHGDHAAHPWAEAALENVRGEQVRAGV